VVEVFDFVDIVLEWWVVGTMVEDVGVVECFELLLLVFFEDVGVVECFELLLVFFEVDVSRPIASVLSTSTLTHKNVSLFMLRIDMACRRAEKKSSTPPGI